MAEHAVGVVGLGGLGSAAAYWLARDGVDVVGFEQFELGHVRGASHDHSRIIRRSYHTPGYVALTADAYAAWAAVERDAEHLGQVTGDADGEQGAEDHGVLGIDEHTALLVDLTAGRVMVEGNGVVTVRRRGSSRTFPAGSSLSLETLAALLRGEQSSVDGAAPDERSGTTGQAPRQDPAPPEGSSALPGSLREEAETALARFDTALASRDADDCVGAVLDLESAIVAWSSDTLQSDDTDQARRALRSMIVRLGELAHRIDANVRRLHGALTKVIAHASLTAKPLSPELIAELVFCDGAGVVLGARLLGQRIKRRITYAEWMWAGRTGVSSPQDEFDWVMSFSPASSFWTVVVDDPGPDGLFDAPIYLRGAAFLHALRLTIGEQAFATVLRRWAARPASVPVSTADLLALSERVSRQQLDALFDEWLHQPTKPALP